MPIFFWICMRRHHETAAGVEGLHTGTGATQPGAVLQATKTAFILCTLHHLTHAVTQCLIHAPSSLLPAYSQSHVTLVWKVLLALRGMIARAPLAVRPRLQLALQGMSEEKERQREGKQERGRARSRESRGRGGRSRRGREGRSRRGRGDNWNKGGR